LKQRDTINSSVSKNKKMSKNKLAIKLSNRVRVVSVSFAIAGLIGGFGIAQADQYDNQITSLQQENNSSQSQVDSLANQASSYQGEINQLQAQVSSLQASLNINEAKKTSDRCLPLKNWPPVRALAITSIRKLITPASRTRLTP
jgi:peptidoglycan hydrolase CwlO-like protein